MSDSIKQLLTQYEPEPPKLDWKAIWIEQGRAEARMELNTIRDHQLHQWKKLSLAFMTLAATLLFGVVFFWSSINRDSSPLAINGRSGTDSSDHVDITSTDRPDEPEPLVDPSISVVSSSSDSSLENSPDIRLLSWLPVWQPVELRPDVANRQRLIAQGLTGLEAFDSTLRRPTAVDRPSTPKKNFNYKDLMERYFILPQTIPNDALRQGDWL